MGGSHSTYWGEENCIQVLVGKPEGKSHLKDPDIDGGLILRWVFRKWDVGSWTGLSWLRIGTDGGYL
jgi:hypothetical protein